MIPTLAPKRSYASVPVVFDWHDYLAVHRQLGQEAALDFRFRPLRLQSTGFQYKCTTEGVTSGKPFAHIRWPTTLGGTVTDGNVVWTAEVLDENSLRTTISYDDWPSVSGLTYVAESNTDFRYQILVSGGGNGQDFLITHRVTLANGELQELAAILPVRD